MRAHLLAALAVFCPSGYLAGSSGQYGARAPARPDGDDGIGAIMLSLSEGLRGMEQGLAEGAWDEVSRHAAAMESSAEVLRQHGEWFGENPSAGAESNARTLAGLCEEVREMPAQRRAGWVAAALKDIRRTCVTCHVTIRPDDPEQGMFPARGNTIAGKVEVLTLAGDSRPDRSGVLVFLETPTAGRTYPLPRKNPIISQANRRFAPRVLPILRGTTVGFPNDDLIFHNVFSLAKTQPFDLGIYKPGDSRTFTFPRAGLVKVYCNIHPKMISNIVVLENPYFGLTDTEGAFVLCDVPDGTYTLRTWHERGGELKRLLTISGSSLTRLTLKVQEDRATLEHKNKFGQPYRKKY